MFLGRVGWVDIFHKQVKACVWRRCWWHFEPKLDLGLLMNFHEFHKGMNQWKGDNLSMVYFETFIGDYIEVVKPLRTFRSHLWNWDMFVSYGIFITLKNHNRIETCKTIFYTLRTKLSNVVSKSSIKHDSLF
jgi:hypothetical protein